MAASQPFRLRVPHGADATVGQGPCDGGDVPSRRRAASCGRFIAHKEISQSARWNFGLDDSFHLYCCWNNGEGAGGQPVKAVIALAAVDFHRGAEGRADVHLVVAM